MPVVGGGTRGVQSSQGGGVWGDGAADPYGEAPPSQGLDANDTTRDTRPLQHQSCHNCSKKQLTGAQPTLPHLSLQSAVPASCALGQGHVNLNQGWKSAAARRRGRQKPAASNGVPHLPLVTAPLGADSGRRQVSTWMGRGRPRSAAGTWRVLPDLLVSVLGHCSSCQHPGPSPSPLLRPTFQGPGTGRPSCTSWGQQCCWDSHRRQTKRKLPSSASGQSSCALCLPEPRTSPAAIPADPLGSSRRSLRQLLVTVL